MPASPGSVTTKVNWPLRVLLGAAIAIPVLAVVVAICVYAVNVPFYDEWNFAELFYKVEAHTLTLHDFLAPHSEHRPVALTLVYFLTTYAGHGDVRVHMFVNVGFACLISFAVYFMSRSAGHRTLETALLMLIPANLLIFGLIQSENWLWAEEGHLTPAAVVGCLAVASSRLRPNVKFPLCILLAIIASYTLAYGLPTWAIALPVLLMRGGHGRGLKIWVAIWIVFMILSAWPFLAGAPKSSVASFLVVFGTYPLAIPNYFFVLIGTPLASGLQTFGLWIVFLVGLLLGAATLFHLLYFARFWRDIEYRNEAVVWVALLLFPVAAGAMITVGRVSAGVAQAMSSRYTTISCLLVVALIYLTDIVLRHRRARHPAASEVAEARAVTATFTAALCLCALTTVASFRDMEARQQFMFGVKTLVTWSQVAYDAQDIGTNVSGPPANVRVWADSMDRQGLLDPKLKRSGIIRQSDIAPGSGGQLESLTPKEDKLVFEGWAILPQRREVADGVVMCWARPGEPWHVFAVTMNKKPRPEIAQSLGDPSYLRCGWAAAVSRSLVPADATMFTAFAFDSLNSRLYQLGQ